MNQFSHFFVGYLREIRVEVADGVERLRHLHADKLVDFGTKPVACGKRGDRDRHDDPRGLQMAKRFGRRQDARSGGDSVVDQYRNSSVELQGCPGTAIKPFTPFQLCLCTFRDLLDFRLRDADRFDQIAIEHANAACCDGAERQAF